MRKVDLVVALPSFNQASTVVPVVQTIVAGLKSSFGQASTLFLNADVGSQDGTPDLVRQAVGGSVPFASIRPHTEGMSGSTFALNRFSYSGMPAREEAFRSVFAVTRRLEADACIVLDPSVRTVTAEWVSLLAKPILEKGADYVAPVFNRQRYEGSLTNNLIAPLTRALYGKRVACQIGGGYGFSQKISNFFLENEALWEGDGGHFAIDSWVTTVAVAEGYGVWQTCLGNKVQDIKAGADISMSLAQAVGATFHYMERYQDIWEKQVGSEEVPIVGRPCEIDMESVPIQVDRMLKGFRQGLRDLLPIWEIILAPDTLAGVLELGLRDDEEFRYPLPLWVQTVYDFAVGYHEKVIHRE
ncbi:MAG TPA: glycosyl transferase family 2, partial [Nitrospira sp.]|nr:glycosyl transferase family 2 [Nitrospira sp.]